MDSLFLELRCGHANHDGGGKARRRTQIHAALRQAGARSERALRGAAERRDRRCYRPVNALQLAIERDFYRREITRVSVQSINLRTVRPSDFLS